MDVYTSFPVDSSTPGVTMKKCLTKHLLAGMQICALDVRWRIGNYGSLVHEKCSSRQHTKKVYGEHFLAMTCKNCKKWRNMSPERVTHCDNLNSSMNSTSAGLNNAIYEQCSYVPDPEAAESECVCMAQQTIWDSISWWLRNYQYSSRLLYYWSLLVFVFQPVRYEKSCM